MASLRVLNLNHCGLTSLPPTLGSLTNLRELRLAHNRLSGLPKEIGSLKRLQKLDADHNQLAAIPGATPTSGVDEVQLWPALIMPMSYSIPCWLLPLQFALASARGCTQLSDASADCSPSQQVLT